MEAFVEFAARPDQDVLGNSEAAERSITDLGILHFRGSVVRDYYHEVVAAVGSGITPGSRTEEVEPPGTIRLHKALYDLGEHWVISRRRC